MAPGLGTPPEQSLMWLQVQDWNHPQTLTNVAPEIVSPPEKSHMLLQDWDHL